MVNGKRKGKTGELELSNVFKDYGYDTKRGVQYCGIAGNADIIGLPGIYVECKRVENLNVTTAMDKARQDCKGEDFPTVFHRKNGKKWLVTMTLDDWMNLYSEWYSGQWLAKNKGD